jgi:4-amino-4-deoxychorismate lyase
MTATTLFNGHCTGPGPELAASRGLHYGHGVFRTCLIYNSEVFDIDGQIKKLLADAKALGLPPPDPQLLLQDARQMARDTPMAVLKILLLAAGEGRGYGAPVIGVDRLLCRYPAPDHPDALWEAGIRAARSPMRLSAQPALAGIKHLNRLEQVVASCDWPPGCEEVLLSDDQGRPLCGTRSNLFWVHAGILRTPGLERCGVAGRTRDRILQCAAQSSLPCRVGEGSWEELALASEIFVCNSVVGIWPVRTLEGWSSDAPGPVTRRLQGALSHPLHHAKRVAA